MTKEYRELQVKVNAMNLENLDKEVCFSDVVEAYPKRLHKELVEIVDLFKPLSGQTPEICNKLIKLLK